MRFPMATISTLALAGGVFLAAAAKLPQAQTIWHVDDDACPGPGSGSESDPFCSIQTAIDTATDGDEVVVRVGTYLENINYLGKAITVRSSDPENPDTVESTIIDGSGATEEDEFGSVVTFINDEESDSLLNGLTLRGGIGRKSAHIRFGGAVSVWGASPTVNNCLLTANSARSGGGLFVIGEGANPVISNCTIRSNTARRGAGIYSSSHSSPRITRCWILDNACELYGAGLYSSRGSPIISNCVIAGNVAVYASALALTQQSAAMVRNSTIVANEAGPEGAAIWLSNSSAVLRNCISWGNTAPDIFEIRLSASVLSVDYCDIQGGEAAVELFGDDNTLLWGVGNLDIDPLFLESQPINPHVFAESPCVNAGDPAFVPDSGEMDIDGEARVIDGNVDMGADEFNPDCNGNGIADEEEIADGSSIDCNGNGIPDECLFLELDCNENAVPDQCDIDQGTSDDCNDNGLPDDCELDCNDNGVSDECDISDGSSDDCDLNGVPDDCEPDCNNNGTLDICDISEGTSEDCTGDEIPDECEPDCNDNGQADICDIDAGFSEDINLNGVPDECDPQVTLYVDDDAAGQPVQDGTAENPYATIGQALETAPTDQALVEIVVADGIYVGEGNKNLDFGGKILTLRSANGPLSTIIDCQGAGRGFFFLNGETRDAILDGFTIRNGRARNGGAIQCMNRSNPTIRNCVLMGNISDENGKGGGLYAGLGSPLITHCIIVGNTAESIGRGGGGVYIVTFGGNVQPSIENSLIVGNTAFRGGGIHNQSALDISNCTIARNTATSRGGGIFIQGSAPVTISNCVLWGDTAEVGSEIHLQFESTSLSIKYSDVQGGQAGVEGSGTLIWEAGNVDADPLFVDADQGDYRLLPGSPAVDAGDSTAVPPDVLDLDGDGDTSEPVPFDLDGQPRFLNEPDTPDTGNPDGVHPIVDMGPYEIGLPGCPDQDIDDGQVTLCHMPQGNAGTITVNLSALPGHLAHGDTCGPCGSFPSCNPPAPPNAPEGQTVWYVDDDTCPEIGAGTPADPFCKIQDGIDASDHGDMVLAAPGTYFENINFLGKSITVQSYEPTNAEVVECTIIDGSQGGEVTSAVAFVEGEDEDSVLQGFTITHGIEGSSGNGIACVSGSDPTIAHCVISNNSAQEGAGIFIDASSPTVSDCTITHNSAFLGGGIKIGPDSNPVIRNCSISDNSSVRGGGIHTVGNVTVTDCLLAGNTTADSGGAGIYNGGGGALVVSGCVFSHNSTNSSGGGGGILNDSDSQVTVSNSVFEGNEAIKGGGILSQSDSQVTVSDCLFQDNVAWWGGGIHALHASSMILTDCTFRQNTATLGSGGGVVSESSDLVATDCIFEGNIAITPPPAGAQQGGALSSDHRPGRPDSTRQAASVTLGYGGGLSVIDAQASVTNCLFIGNMGFRGGAVSCISQSSLDLAHCTISGNHADAIGGGVYISGDVDVVVDNCILRNDTAPEGPEFLISAGPSTLAVGYSNVEGGQEGIGGGGTIIWGDGNIDLDPLFVDPFGNDYRLLSGSPSIDAGDNTAVPADIVTDLDGNPRFSDDPDTLDTGNPDGINPIVDMGPYEFQDPCADNDGDGQVTICHHPNSGNPQTMSVNQNNLPAHLAHGDHCGPCEE